MSANIERPRFKAIHPSKQISRETWIKAACNKGVLEIILNGQRTYVRPVLDGYDVVFYRRAVERWVVAWLREDELKELVKEGAEKGAVSSQLSKVELASAPSPRI